MRAPDPLRAIRRSDDAGVVVLTLETPGGAINVFTREAALELSALLREISPQSARAVVVRSSKPKSFVNGVGLLLAGTLKSADDAARLAGPVRDAYRALRECPVPTIAAIEGNCYGCGVELALQCRYRVASDAFDTQFYMTEVAEYLFIPTFGGTQDLPRLLGLERAIDFVLWGARWSARNAQEVGLVDRCFPAAAFKDDLVGFVREVASAPPGHPHPIPPRPPPPLPDERERIVARARQRIGKLPPSYRSVYSTCLELMVQAACGEPPAAGDYEREMREAAQSVLAAPCRAAWPFFFLRQMAAATARGPSARGRSPAVVLGSADPELSLLATELAHRRGAVPIGGLPARFILATSSSGDDESSPDGPSRVIVSTELVSGAACEAPLGLHIPLRSVGIDIAEVSCRGDRERAAAQRLAAFLADCDMVVIPSRPRVRLFLDDLVAAWLAPQLAYLSAGGSPAALAAALRQFGFTRFGGDWVGTLGVEPLARAVAEGGLDLAAAREAVRALPTRDVEDAAPAPAALSALLTSLGAFAFRALRDGIVSHPAVLDVAARDVIDFPLLRTSLCRYLTVARARELLQSRAAVRSLVTSDDHALLEVFVDHGREHYADGSRARRAETAVDG